MLVRTARVLYHHLATMADRRGKEWWDVVGGLWETEGTFDHTEGTFGYAGEYLRVDNLQAEPKPFGGRW